MRIVSLLLCAAALALAGVARAADPAPASGAAPAADAAGLGPVGYDASGRPGRIHTVVSGDTLWDISEAYLGTPWVWPSIWQDNPEVPNPHRIFPGDRIWISPTSMRRVTDAEAESLLSGQPADAVPAAFEDAMPVPLGSVRAPDLGSVGMISNDALVASGSILDSVRPDILLAQDLPVFISLGEGQVERGDRFDIVHIGDDVRDPETGRRIGFYADAVGWLEVTKVHAESSEAMIRVSTQEVQRGDRILPRVEPDTDIALRMPMSAVEGQVAFFPYDRTIMAQRDYVLLNRGTDHGLAVGNPLEVYRPLGEARDVETGARHMLPDEVIGNLVVVKAEPNSSVAMVLHAREELARGDRFRTDLP